MIINYICNENKLTILFTARHFANINFGNFKMKIKSTDLFEVPNNCEEVQKFVSVILSIGSDIYKCFQKRSNKACRISNGSYL